MYPRQEIIKNQRVHKDEIIQWLKNDFIQTKKELNEIKSSAQDEDIKKAQKKLLLKAKAVKVEKEIMSLFIHEDNVYPKFYAWWDSENEDVLIYKYNQ